MKQFLFVKAVMLCGMAMVLGNCTSSPQYAPSPDLISTRAPVKKVVAGCPSATGPQPDWVMGTSAKYSEERYITGVGQGASRQEAEAQARAAMAKVFKAEVTASEFYKELFQSRQGMAQTSTIQELEARSLTTLTSDKTLRNVHIAQLWQDPSTCAYSSLAALDRTAGATALRDRIAELDASITREVQAFTQPRESDGKIEQVKQLLQAINNLAVRKGYNEDLRVITGRGGIASPYSEHALNADLDRLVAEHFLIAVDITGDEAESIGRAVSEGLLRAGMAVTSKRVGTDKAVPASDEERPALLIKGEGAFWPAKINTPPWIYARWCADFVVTDTRTGRMIGAMSRSGKEASTSSLGEAQVKAQSVMQEALIGMTTQLVAGYIFGERAARGTRNVASSCPNRKTLERPRRVPPRTVSEGRLPAGERTSPAPVQPGQPTMSQEPIEVKGYLFEFEQCTKLNQTIDCALLVTSLKEDRNFQIRGNTIFDNVGDARSATKMGLANTVETVKQYGEHRRALVIGVPVRANLSFAGVSDQTSMLTKLQLDFRHPYGSVIFRNIPLTARLAAGERTPPTPPTPAPPAPPSAPREPLPPVHPVTSQEPIEVKGYLFELEQCTKFNQTIDCALLVTSLKEDRNFQIRGNTIFDNLGDARSATKMGLANTVETVKQYGEHRRALVIGVPVRANLSFAGVSAQTSMLTKFQLDFRYPHGSVIFRNIPLTVRSAAGESTTAVPETR